MARRPRAAPVAPVVWRDGVHLWGTPIWCDARRRRDVCFVSSAEYSGAAGHGQAIATPATLALIGPARSGDLAAPLRRPFTLGTLRLELVPTGRTLGAAALYVDLGDRSVLYAGAVRTRDAAEPAEVRAADAVVVAAPLGEPHHVLPKRAAVAHELATWIRAQLAAARVPVLVAETALDALEIAAQLAPEGLPFTASRSVRDAATRAKDLVELPALRAPAKARPQVVLRAAADRLELANAAPAIVSAHALDAPVAAGARFAWPFVAGRDELLGWIEQTRAKQIFVTGACAEAIVAALGPRARVLGPPRQMQLFPREAAR